MSLSGGDVRKDYVLGTVAKYFGLPDASVAELAKSPKLNNFLDDGNSPLLCAYLEKVDGGQGDKVHLDNAAHVGITDNKVRD